MSMQSSMRSSLRSFSHRRPPHRRRAHGALQLAARARQRRQRSCCGSRTPTANDRPRRTSSRSSTRSRWLELDWDEGPIFQTANEARHQEALRQLLDAGHAYRTTATGDDVKAWKAQHGDDRGFRGTPEEEGAYRLRVPDEGETVVHDAIRGDAVFQHVHIDDPVIARADGSVLYNFAVAIDDLDAGVTHVVRGEDHLSNTPKQLLVFEALGERAPVYAHLPLLHGPDGKKLSKRHGAASVQELRDQGYLPEAVNNYVALLGAGFDPERELFTVEELARLLRLERISKSPAVFDERKLRHINGIYVRELSVDELTQRLETFTGRSGLRGAVEISREKIQTLADFWPLAGFFFDGPADDEGVDEDLRRRGRGRRPARRARGAGDARAVHAGGRRGRAARPAGRQRLEAEARLPAGPRRARRHDDLARDLRVGRAARARGDAEADRRGARARRLTTRQRRLDSLSGRFGLNLDGVGADTPERIGTAASAWLTIPSQTSCGARISETVR